jgi:hypothetical protein
MTDTGHAWHGSARQHSLVQLRLAPGQARLALGAGAVPMLYNHPRVVVTARRVHRSRSSHLAEIWSTRDPSREGIH